LIGQVEKLLRGRRNRQTRLRRLLNRCRFGQIATRPDEASRESNRVRDSPRESMHA
jgi:hypothetical protein